MTSASIEKQVFRLVFSHFLCPVPCSPFLKQQLQCMTSFCVLVYCQAKKLNIIEEIPLITSFSHLLQAPSESCMVLVMPAELRAARGWKQSWGKKTCKTTVQHSQGDEREKGEMLERDWTLESGVAGASRQSLNKAGEKERNTGKRRESKRAAGPGLPRSHRQLLLDCLLESDRATPHFSAPLLWEMTTNFPSLSSEKAPPQSNLCLSYFSNHMGPGAFCYLVTWAVDPREHVT